MNDELDDSQLEDLVAQSLELRKGATSKRVCTCLALLPLRDMPRQP